MMDNSPFLLDPNSSALQSWRCLPALFQNNPNGDGFIKDLDTNGQLPDRQSLLPNAIPLDPRLWSPSQVCSWLEWCVDQFSLPPIDLEHFPMNGRALCLLTKTDFKDRVPRVGDVLFNTLHILIHKCLPPSTPTSSHLPILHSASSSPSNVAATPSSSSSLHHPHRLLSPHPHVSNLLLGQATEKVLNGNVGTGRYNWSRTVASSDLTSLGYVVQDTGGSGGGGSNVSTPSGGDVDSTVILSPAPSNEGAAEKSAHHQQHLRTTTGGRMIGGTTRDGEEHLKRNHGSDEDSEEPPSLKSSSSPSPPHTSSNHHPSSLRLTSSNTISVQSASAHLVATINNHNNNNGLNNNGIVIGSDIPQEKSVRLLWDFLQQLLNDSEERYARCICWKDKSRGVFKIVDPHQLAYLWGMQKNHLNMNFDKMSRALRYYYRVKILQKEPGERHCYRFLRHPNELRNCKQRSLLSKSISSSVSSISTTSVAAVKQQSSSEMQSRAKKPRNNNKNKNGHTKNGGEDLSLEDDDEEEEAAIDMTIKDEWIE